MDSPFCLSIDFLMVRLRSLFGIKSYKMPGTPDDRFRWDNNPLRGTLLHLLHCPSLEQFGIYGVDDFSTANLALCTSLRELTIKNCSTDGHTILAHDFPNILPFDSVWLQNLAF